MHFYESSIITTKDGLQCQVYGNEHPLNMILVKPKYIPTDKIECDTLQCRFILGRKMNRLNMWAPEKSLREYLKKFKSAYPQYIYKSSMHEGSRLFFGVSIDDIERIFFPRRGLKELMKMPEDSFDEHLKAVHNFVKLLLESGLRLKDLGITYSTLMGHYFSKISDINIVVYGKENFWKLMKFLENAKHAELRWKTKEEWSNFYKKRNRFKIFDEDEFITIMKKKRSEGYFNNNLFVIFAVEKEEEVWFKWDEEKYTSLGLATIQGVITDNFSSVVRPGCYKIKDSKIIDGKEDVDVKMVVFYSRDYCMLAYPNEKIEAKGILEKVEPKDGKPYYRIVIGYFDAHLNGRREEYIKLIQCIR